MQVHQADVDRIVQALVGLDQADAATMSFSMCS
jgi:hypothetical protein